MKEQARDESLKKYIAIYHPGEKSYPVIEQAAHDHGFDAGYGLAQQAVRDRVGEYEAMLADADSIRIPTDDLGHFTTISKFAGGGTLTQHWAGKWQVGANYDEVFYETPLEAYKALKLESEGETKQEASKNALTSS